MGLFDRDPTTKSGLKPKPRPLPMEHASRTVAQREKVTDPRYDQPLKKEKS